MKYVTREEFAKAVEEIKAMIEAMDHKKKEEEKMSEETKEETELSAEAAEPIKHNPEAKLKAQDGLKAITTRTLYRTEFTNNLTNKNKYKWQQV